MGWLSFQNSFHFTCIRRQWRFCMKLVALKSVNFRWERTSDLQMCPARLLSWRIVLLSRSDDSYYENLNKLGEEIRTKFWLYWETLGRFWIFEKSGKEKVTQTSLLRSVSSTTVLGQFPSLTQGRSTLKIQISYKAPRRVGQENLPLSIVEVEPESSPPTNIHYWLAGMGSKNVSFKSHDTGISG